jgi:hypothetical protein
MKPSITADRLVVEAQALLEAGKAGEAIEACRRALAIEPDCLAAHVCMARARLPGDDYLVHLRRFHETLRPRTYVEIGVDAGRTLSLARPPTLAFGVDPAQNEAPAFAAQTRLFAMESDAFFESGQAAEALGGLPIDLAFVDGLHLFEQVLRDFIHLERHAGRGSVVLFHDCLPLDRATASRVRRTGFWTGDVWKIAPILAAHRPDLTVFVIPAWPTGLGVVTGLDPASRALTNRFEQIVAEFVPMEWSEETDGACLPLVANDGPAILARIGRVGRAG